MCWHRKGFVYSEFLYTLPILQAVRFRIFVIPIDPELEPVYYIVPTSRMVEWLGNDPTKTLRIYPPGLTSKNPNTFDLRPYKGAWHLIK